MPIKPQGNFAEIVTVDPAAFEGVGMFEAFGLDPRADVLPQLNEWVSRGIIHPGYGGRMNAEEQPRPEGEPRAWLIASDKQYRSGVLCTICEIEGRPTLVGASVFFEGGVQHQLEIDRIIVSQDRVQGILAGGLDDTIEAMLLEPTFASDRQWHGKGSVHQVAVYAIAYSLNIGAPPPIEVADPLDRESGKTRMLHFDDAAMLMSVSGGPGWLYDVIGPVSRCDAFDFKVLGQEIWKMRVTAARIGDDNDQDFDIDVFVSQPVLGDRKPPKIGEIVQCRIALCCRLWIANTGYAGS